MSLFLKAISLLLLVIIRSSAYRITCTPALIPLLLGLAFPIAFSTPLRATLHSVGEIIPPCGGSFCCFYVV
jgi:hypothetical protein